MIAKMKVGGGAEGGAEEKDETGGSNALAAR